MAARLSVENNHQMMAIPEEFMNARLRAMVSVAFALFVALTAQARAEGREAKLQYPGMAPLDQYLMDREAEIILARSAAPEAISSQAKVLVLTSHGYETAIQGKNGFVCLVERAWLNLFDNPQFWNPKIRGAVCYNPPAVRSVLPITYMRTQMVLAGVPQAKMPDRIKQAYAEKRLPELEPGAMCYMMAKQSYLTDDPITNDGAHNIAHLMFYTPLMDGAVWGADLPKSPIYLNPQFHGAPEPIDVFMSLTGKWSDGSPAPLD
jgi:hypothetical protein